MVVVMVVAVAAGDEVCLAACMMDAEENRADLRRDGGD